MLSTTLYKCAVCSKVGIIRNEILMFWFLSMCKLRRITHKLNIKSFRLYSICEWLAGVYTSIKTKGLYVKFVSNSPEFTHRSKPKLKFHSYNNRHSELIVKYTICLKALVQQGISELAFYGDIAHFEIIVGKPSFSDHIKNLRWLNVIK